MKVLTGIHQPDGGSMTFEGKPYSVRNIREALELGIGMIHQELNMMNHLTVAQNIFTVGKAWLQISGSTTRHDQKGARTFRLYRYQYRS